MPTIPSSSDHLAVVYCRVSGERQATEDKGSLDAQERGGRAKVAELELTVLYVVRDAESAWILDKRSKFQRMLDDARAGKFRHLIVDRMNRFTRSEDLTEYMSVMTELKGAGVILHFADKTYERSTTGQLLMTLDAYTSAVEQANRRKQSLIGKRARVTKLGRPLPGSWPPYGYRWVDAEKTRLEKDPGESQGVVDRIWQSLLYGEPSSLSGLAKALDRDHIMPPGEYAGVKRYKNAVKSGPRWTAVTISLIVHNPLYWGGDDDGMVEAFKTSTQGVPNPVRIPTYAPPYVTREEAARVHARLASNQKYAPRNRRHEWDTLLHGGLARCAECGWALTPYKNCRPRADGSVLTLYRCPHKPKHPQACGGVSISAELLDYAVAATLDMEINKKEYLTRLFAAWDRDAEAAMGSVRSIERTLKETQQQIDNQMQRLATLAPGDPLAPPVEVNVRMLAEALPNLQQRLARAQAAVNNARNNPTLRYELAEWFDGWMSGFISLPRAKQREFLFAIKAKVLLWRADERTPRAQLIIELPTAPLTLPPAPSSTLHQDAATGAWRMDVDMEEGQRLVEADRAVELHRGLGDAFDRDKAQLDRANFLDHTTAEAMMTGIKETLEEQGNHYPQPLPGNCVKSVGTPYRNCW